MCKRIAAAKDPRASIRRLQASSVQPTEESPSQGLAATSSFGRRRSSALSLLHTPPRCGCTHHHHHNLLGRREDLRTELYIQPLLPPNTTRAPKGRICRSESASVVASVILQQGQSLCEKSIDSCLPTCRRPHGQELQRARLHLVEAG